jgi:hypothetical protein
LLNEGDGQTLLQAIVDTIEAQTDIEALTLVAIKAQVAAALTEYTAAKTSDVQVDVNVDGGFTETDRTALAAKATSAEMTAAVSAIKGADDKDLTQVFDNTPDVELGTLPADVLAIKASTDTTQDQVTAALTAYGVATASGGFTGADRATLDTTMLLADAIKDKTDTLVNGPTAEEISAEIAEDIAADIASEIASELAGSVGAINVQRPGAQSVSVSAGGASDGYGVSID